VYYVYDFDFNNNNNNNNNNFNDFCTNTRMLNKASDYEERQIGLDLMFKQCGWVSEVAKRQLNVVF